MVLENKKIICCAIHDEVSFFVYTLCKSKTLIFENNEYSLYYSNDYDFYLFFFKNIFNKSKIILKLKELSEKNYVHYVICDTDTGFVSNHLEREMDFTNFDYSIMFYPGEFLTDDNPFKLKEFKHLKYLFSSTKTINKEGWLTWQYENADNFFFDINYGILFGFFKLGFNYVNPSHLDFQTPKLDKVFVYTKAQDRVGRINSVKEFENIDRFYQKKFSKDDYFCFEVNRKANHFSNILDYNCCKFNLVLETLDFTYDMVYFLSEKTVKGLMYNTPFYVNANSLLINELKSKGYYVLNEEFDGENYKNYKNFCDFMRECSDEQFDELHNRAIEKTKNNRNILIEYIYSDKVKEINLLINK